MSTAYPEVLRSQIAALDTERDALEAELAELTITEERTAEQVESRATEIGERATAINTERADKVALLTELEQVRQERADVPKGPQFIRKPDPNDALNDRAADPMQLADALTRAVEEQTDDADNLANARKIFKRHRNDTAWARELLVRSTPAYESGWSKLVTGRGWQLTNEERTALSTMTSANGDYLVPTHLDPTIMLSNSGTQNAIRKIARVVTLTRPGDSSWQGITSAGSDASFDGQLAEVSDDSPTFTQPTIAVHRAQQFIQASVEAAEDIPGLASELLVLFADGKDRLEAAKHATGSGTNEPWGIFTALDANTNVEITSDTAAAINKEDLDELYYSVPARFRGRSSWLMHPRWNLEIQNLGTAVSAKYTTDLTMAPSQFVLGRPVVESDDAPTTATTTVRDNRLILGDFQQYVIVDKPGSFSIQFIPALFNTSTNLPDGRVGWYAYWRTGADSVIDTAFRLLQDKTSA